VACKQTCATSREKEEGQVVHKQNILERNFIGCFLLFGEGNARVEVEIAERCHARPFAGVFQKFIYIRFLNF
jgi:hypothetical protein